MENSADALAAAGLAEFCWLAESSHELATKLGELQLIMATREGDAQIAANLLTNTDEGSNGCAWDPTDPTSHLTNDQETNAGKAAGKGTSIWVGEILVNNAAVPVHREVTPEQELHCR